MICKLILAYATHLLLYEISKSFQMHQIFKILHTFITWSLSMLRFLNYNAAFNK